VVAVILVAVVVLSSGGGSPKKSASSTSATTTTSSGKTHSPSSHKKSTKTTKSSAPATSPAETIVTVLNGTEKAGLAHSISGQLQQRGYSQAAALSGQPAGTHPLTVVQYAPGHQAEAEGVAHTLGVTEVQHLEAAVAAMAGSAKVVVIVGADKATTVP
jgi:hypothetical protein